MSYSLCVDLSSQKGRKCDAYPLLALQTGTMRLHDTACTAMVSTVACCLDMFSSTPSLIGSAPQCITGVMNFAHGTVQQNSNGSLTLYPLGDGFQQIQAPCAPTSNFIETYNDTELYQSWQVFQDPVLGTTLQLAQFDLSLLPPLYLVSTTPNMLPTQALRNVSASSNISKRSTNDALPTSRWATASLIAIGGLLGSALVLA
jgi:hypothetical protein